MVANRLTAFAVSLGAGKLVPAAPRRPGGRGRHGTQAREPVLVPAHARQDYAFGQPSLTRKKLRRLKLAAGARSRKGQVRAGAGLRNNETRDAERALAIQAVNAYRRTLAD